MTTDRSVGAELLTVVARLNRWATRGADLRVPPAKARLMAHIEEIEPARIGQLAEADHCRQPTMTTQIQRLEELGWVRRVPDPDDARASLISLTNEGRRLLAEVRRARAAVVTPVVHQLSTADQERLDGALDVLERLLKVAGPPSASHLAKENN